MSVTVPSPAEVEYPCSDGKPMSDNDWQAAAILYLMSRPHLPIAGATPPERALPASSV